MKRASWLLVLGALLVLPGCSSDDGGSGGVGGGNGTRVVFAYDAPTALDTAVRSAYPDCFRIVGPTHMHPSWLNFAVVPMRAVGTNRFEVTLDGVPPGQELMIGVNDPNLCSASNFRGFVLSGVSANGVALTRVGTVSHTHGDSGQALMFQVAADGSVNP